ncbi:MAG: hypothetical protein M3261_05790, partial [Thermoproteota archaeon]|nr:hypothetical protein [Thermoproteota archaeon]
PLGNTPTSNSSLSNAYDKGARQLAYLSLIISMLVFLFGDGIVGKIHDYIREHWSQFPESINSLEGSIAILNVLLAAFALWDPKTRQAIKLADNTSIPSSTKDSFRKLMLGWRLLWLSRMLLYIWFGILWFGLHTFFTNTQVPWYIASALHLLVGFFHYFLFFVLDPPSIATESRPDSAIVFRRGIITMMVLGCVVYIASVLITSYRPILSEWGVTSILSHRLIPTYAGIGMAFLIGRLDSHYLRIPRILLAPLYLYVIVQPLWGNIAESNFGVFNRGRAAIFVLVLILKFVFFYSVVKWIRNGGFLQYLIKIEGDRNK